MGIGCFIQTVCDARTCSTSLVPIANAYIEMVRYALENWNGTSEVEHIVASQTVWNGLQSITRVKSHAAQTLKEHAVTAFIPECASAIGACSRLEPHPKFFPATIMSPPDFILE